MIEQQTQQISDASTMLEHEVKAPIIETVGLSKTYYLGSEMVTPVTDVTLQVGYGDLAVIFGQSGAGKSTLLNMLMGLEPPDLGEVFLKGSSLYDYSEENRALIRRKKISYLPQNQYWLDHLNMVENVALPLLLNGTGRIKALSQATEMLKDFGLGSRLKHKPDELSTGQQQKAALARAMIKNPWLIFADEPTAHLDTKSVEEVTEILLDAVNSKGATVIMVTHDFDYLKLSKKWFFMRDGRLWDIEDHRSPLNDIKDALAYVDKLEVEGRST
ncbi:MAG TPA: ABC transporter ATP-binding protein [Candidatus Saccharibacteria bacterium]|nr:ABC transporter ATP-binding protein [Candidatus Saccharibacteria bacterium]